MKLLQTVRALCLGAALATSAPSMAGVILDTGQPHYADTAYNLATSPLMGTFFSINEAVILDTAQGWVYGTGTMNLQIFDVKGGKLSTVLYSQNVTKNLAANAWTGVQNMGLNLGAGKYFLALGIPSGYRFNGGMFTGAPHQTELQGFYFGSSMLTSPYTGLGFQIFSKDLPPPPVAPVPEPAAAAVFGLGLLLLGLSRRKQG
jgi:hypothetical protein